MPFKRHAEPQKPVGWLTRTHPPVTEEKRIESVGFPRTAARNLLAQQRVESPLLGNKWRPRPSNASSFYIPRCGESETVAEFAFRCSKIIPFSVLDGTTPIEYGD